MAYHNISDSIHVTNMITITQYQYDALISENKSLENTVSILQNNADSLRELQNKHDTFMNGIRDREIEHQKLVPVVIVAQNKHADEPHNIQFERINLKFDNLQKALVELEANSLIRETKILFYKFAAAFQEINVKYKLDKSLELPFNSKRLQWRLMHKMPIYHFHKDYLFENDSELDDTAIIIYDKIQFLRTKLSELSEDMVKSFEASYGTDLVKEMLIQLDKILQEPKPLGSISDEERDEYVHWFDM